MFESAITPSPMARAIQLCLLAAAGLGVAAGASAAPGTTRVIVAFKPGAVASVKAAVRAARGMTMHEIHGMNAIAVEVPAPAVAALQRNPNVDYVEEDVKRYPLANPPASAEIVPYGITLVQADQLPDTYAANRKVCVIDSGYDLGHEDLAGNDVAGDNDPGTGLWSTDELHHGTHVTGTIAAIDNHRGVLGVAPNGRLKLHIVKVFGADGWAYSSTLASAANKCGAAGANVITMSLGGAIQSRTENNAFKALAANGVLSFAAAGNDGNTRASYPAGYASVVSVGALDANKQWASFSQYNRAVELSGPGVNVLSTVPMGMGSASALTVGGTVYAPGAMDGSPRTSASGALANFGLGDAVNPAMAGKVCLIARGSIDFATKVSNCQNSGAVAAVVYNNVAGGFGGTLGSTVTTIPSVTASDTEGAALLGQLGQSATVAVSATNYAHYDGTSMATPHVSAVAALVWSYFPACSAAQIRSTLAKSAEDLGSAGRDTRYGYGLVRAKAAYDRLNSLGCNN